MAVKIQPKQQAKFKELQQSDKNMAKNIADAMGVLNALPFDVESGMVQVKLAIDVSGSMQGRYNNGSVQKLVEQFLSVGFLFDDNGSIQVYPFDDGVYRDGSNYRGRKIQLPEITLDNYQGYVDRYIKPLVGGSTNYAPAIRAVAKEMSEGGVGFCGFFTDGQCFDDSDAAKELREASRLPLFFQFAGIGDNDREFSFLKNLDNLSGRQEDNAGFYLCQLGESNQSMMRRLLSEFAGIDPVTGQRSGQKPYPEKIQGRGLVDSTYQWDGRKRL